MQGIDVRASSRRKMPLGGYLIWVAFVLCLAHFTGYRADATKALTWAIAFMLTPFGLIQNLFFGAHDYLRYVYFESPPPLAFSAAQEGWNWHYLQIFWQSNLLEVLPLLLFYPRWRPAGLNFARITIVNSVTHPIVFFGLMRMPFPYVVNILIAETFAVVAEWLAYRHMGLPKPFVSSLYANLISWQLAPALTVYFFLLDRIVVR